MDSPVSVQEPDHEHEQSPRRLSALYQYHNAPEVAPAHGLEYDDTIYPSSDKMTIVREMPFRRQHYTGKHALENDNRPPRIIFGMKLGTFLVVALVVLLIVVGAAVGGAVGGKHMNQGPVPSSPDTWSSTTTAAAPSPTLTTRTYAAPTPSYTPLSSCNKSTNETSYTPADYPIISNGHRQKQTFTMYCGVIPQQAAKNISSAFVYSFSDCVDVCASYNSFQDQDVCNVAFYNASSVRPSNCVIGSTQILVGGLKAKAGTDVGILEPPL